MAFNNPIFIKWNEPAQVVQNEQVIVTTDGVATLSQIPDSFAKVQIDNMYEVKQEKPITDATQFRVNYRNGMLTFHPSKIGQFITIKKYNGLGVILYPSNRIYDLNSGGTVDTAKTLQDFIDVVKLISWKGDYDDNILYSPNAIVYYPQEKTIYECIKLTKGNVPTNTTYWRPLISVKEASDFATAQGNFAKAQGDYAKQTGDDLNVQINNFQIKGDYDPNTQYYPKNIVYYSNTTYINKVACKGVDPTDNTKWDVIVSTYNLAGDFLYTAKYNKNDIVHFGVEKAIYECIKPTNEGISPYNTVYWRKRIDISDLIVKVTDYVGDVTSLYTAYDNGITINHNLNGYVQCLAIVSGAGYGNSGYGMTGYGEEISYELKTRLQYIDLNNVKVFFDAQYSGTPTVVKVDANTWSVTFSGENTAIQILIKKFI